VTQPPTWEALWRETAARLRGGLDLSDDEANVEARWLCEEASGIAHHDWFTERGLPATRRTMAHLDAMIARRLAGEPLPYVLGSWSFRGLDLMVDRRVLIPRSDTEQVVEVALAIVRSMTPPVVAADLGTGSGAIALSLVAEMPPGAIEMWATDASSAALEVARANLAGIGRVASQVRMVEGSWWDALPASLHGALDVVVTNPPYVATTDHVDDSVTAWEPMQGLYAGADGLDDVRVIIDGAATWLRPGGFLVMEIGAEQGILATTLASAAGLIAVEVKPDLAGRDRALVAKRPGP
jgi:release factor glutamine methyltransferase